MLGMQVLLGDIVRRRTRSVWPVVFVLLAPEAALYYGQMMAVVMPEIPLVLFLATSPTPKKGPILRGPAPSLIILLRLWNPGWAMANIRLS
jgi:hypothetical protein